MGFDRKRLLEIFDALGGALTKPTTVCLIGSSPGIASGQPDRQTPDIDVWRGQSSYDETAFRKACEDAGILFDPRGEQLDPEAIYVQIIRKGHCFSNRVDPVKYFSLLWNRFFFLVLIRFQPATKD